MKIHFTSLTAMAMAIHLFQSPVQASETDDRIESGFKKTYVYKTYLHEDNIKVHSKDGMVSLKGEVAQESHKSLAAETIAEIPGVKKVDNGLRVKGKQPDKDSDMWIKTKVETVLLFHRNVSVVNTDVSVKKGVVLLKGNAENQAQKDLTSAYIMDVDGVKSVTNEMKVAPGASSSPKKNDENVDDASITALVKVSMYSHRSTSGLNTHVKTKDGKVTLTGKARNAAEKDLVTKLVSDIDGVKDVDNNMSVDSEDIKG